jgi:N-acetylmuramoyl-L-alanine amidase CwlA
MNKGGGMCTHQRWGGHYCPEKYANTTKEAESAEVSVKELSGLDREASGRSKHAQKRRGVITSPERPAKATKVAEEQESNIVCLPSLDQQMARLAVVIGRATNDVEAEVLQALLAKFGADR